MKNKTIRCLIKQPGELFAIGGIDNTLESLQEYVGGYIETVTFADDVVIICNEEGRLKGLPYNCTICGMDFVGPILIVGRKRDKFCSLSQYIAASLQRRL